jgi:hypothetical protein
VIGACGRFARKYPSLSLLIWGVLISVSPVGLGMNMKLLDEHDLIPDQIRPLFPIISVLMGVVALIGYILIGQSALVAVRRLTNKKMADLISNDRTAVISNTNDPACGS